MRQHCFSFVAVVALQLPIALAQAADAVEQVANNQPQPWLVAVEAAKSHDVAITGGSWVGGDFRNGAGSFTASFRGNYAAVVEVIRQVMQASAGLRVKRIELRRASESGEVDARVLMTTLGSVGAAPK